jgi:hypothetical protein
LVHALSGKVTGSAPLALKRAETVPGEYRWTYPEELTVPELLMLQVQVRAVDLSPRIVLSRVDDAACMSREAGVAMPRPDAQQDQQQR